MEWRKQHVVLLGQAYQIDGFGRGRGHRLVDDDILPGAENFFGKCVVGSVGRGHDKEAERGIGEHGIERTVDLDAGVALSGFVAGSLHDRSKFEAFN